MNVIAKMQPLMADQGTNAIIRKTCLVATSILLLLWLFFAAMVVVSIAKPA